MPTVSVILPVFNGLPYLEEAINSLLQQTFTDFEFLIIDDGSTDDSGNLLKALNDPRIRFFQQPNQGLPSTLNKAILLSRGQYIARLDQDDVCMPQRIQKQVEFLDANLDVGLVGTAAEIWVGNEPTSRLLSHPVDGASLTFGLLFDNYIVHSSVMIRRTVFDKVGGYSEDKSRQPPEDYELWSRVMRTYKVANLPDALMVYREVPGSMSRTGNNPFNQKLVIISAENIAWASGCADDRPEVIAISKLLHSDYRAMPLNVSFSTMQLILNKAMLRIAEESSVQPETLLPYLQNILNRLRYHYVDYFLAGMLGKALNSSIGRVIRSFANKLLKGRH